MPGQEGGSRRREGLWLECVKEGRSVWMEDGREAQSLNISTVQAELGNETATAL